MSERKRRLILSKSIEDLAAFMACLHTLEYRLLSDDSLHGLQLQLKETVDRCDEVDISDIACGFEWLMDMPFIAINFYEALNANEYDLVNSMIYRKVKEKLLPMALDSERQYALCCERQVIALVHGDLYGRHLVSDLHGNKVIGALDWSDAGIGDLAQEFGCLLQSDWSSDGSAFANPLFERYLVIRSELGHPLDLCAKCMRQLKCRIRLKESQALIYAIAYSFASGINHKDRKIRLLSICKEVSEAIDIVCDNII